MKGVTDPVVMDGMCDDGRLRMTCPIYDCRYSVAVQTNTFGYVTPARFAAWHERLARHIRSARVRTRG